MTEDEITREVARVRAAMAADEPEAQAHLSFEELAAFVDGTATAEVSAHVASCEMCRGEAEDLAPLRVEPATPLWLGVAIAAAVAVALLALLLRAGGEAGSFEPVRVIRTTTRPLPGPAPTPTPTPAPPQQRYARPEWQRLIDAAVASGRLPFPDDLDELRGDGGTLRGARPGAAASLEPAGIVIAETRPRFSWPAVEGATYVVSVFDGEKPVAESGPLTVARWTPARPLPRGRTYTWQVDAGTRFFPEPPEPPARFRIISHEEHDELRTARRAHPEDHLLLAVLHARAGLVREAERELAASRDPRAASLR